MTGNLTYRTIEILLVEDSPTDALLTQEALDQSQVRNRLHLVENGVEALSFLRREGKYAGLPRPDIILLDLNLPKKGGLEVLEEIKKDEELRLIPVVILSTSRAQDDVLKAYGLNANCYVVKSVDFAEFTHILRSLREFWFDVVTLPPVLV